LQLPIEKLVYGGDGLARLPADEHGRREAVFVPFVLAGEIVEASLLEQKRSFARGWPQKIIEPSRYRIQASCPYFGSCGGCHYQHANYEHQLQIKESVLKENLQRIAKVELTTEPKIHASSPWNYRNRTRLKTRSEPEPAIGYYKLRSHEMLAIEQCPISSPLINRVIAGLWQAGKEGEIPNQVEEIELFANGDDTRVLLELYCGTGLGEAKAISAAKNIKKLLPEVAGVVIFRLAPPGPEPKHIAHIGDAHLMYKTCEASYRVSAGSFFQVNRHLIDHLISMIMEGSDGHLALDLYAGVGLFSSALARRFAQVIAVESSPTAYADLVYNSPSNVNPVQASTDQFLQGGDFKLRPDLIVVDPPRNGLGETVVRSLVGLGAHRIHYVSCDPATVSRDLSGLLRAGYRIEQAHLVDLFPQTYHLESVFKLVR
jgi:23S rRNA (uracil1939-C5)-methyltransferase